MNEVGFYHVRSMPVRGAEFFLLLASLAMVLAGCTGTREAYRAADTLNETAYVVAEHYDITLAQIDAYVNQPDCTAANTIGCAQPKLKAKLQDIVREGQDVILEFGHAADTYGHFKSAETEEQLAQALNRLLVQLNKLLIAIREM